MADATARLRTEEAVKAGSAAMAAVYERNDGTAETEELVEAVLAAGADVAASESGRERSALRFLRELAAEANAEDVVDDEWVLALWVMVNRGWRVLPAIEEMAA